MEKAARRVAFTSAIIHALVHAAVLLLPALIGDVSRAFGVSTLDVLLAANLMVLVFGFVALPTGILADRFGSRSMLMAAAIGSGASSLLIALAPTFPTFVAGLALLGLSAGLYHPSGLSLLSRGVASAERGRAIGIHGIGGSFGEMIAPALAASFALTVGWRWTFAVLGAACMLSASFALTLPPPTPARGPGRSLADVVSAVRAMWASRPLRWLLLSGMAGGFVYRGVLTFLPMHLGGVAGLRVGAYLTTLVLAAGLLAQGTGGWLADRLPRERLFLAEVALVAPLLLMLGLVRGHGLVALALAFGFLWYLAQPLANALGAAYADAKDHGLLYGLQFALSFGVGSFASSVGGLLVERGGTPLAFVGFGAAGVVQLASAAALVRSARTAPQAVAATT